MATQYKELTDVITSAISRLHVLMIFVTVVLLCVGLGSLAYGIKHENPLVAFGIPALSAIAALAWWEILRLQIAALQVFLCIKDTAVNTREINERCLYLSRVADFYVKREQGQP